MPRALLAIALAAFASALAPAHAQTLLRNDSFEPGDAVGFYTRINLEESFAAIYAVPDDYPRYRICRVFAFVGPNAFNIYALRIGVGEPDGGEAALIWQDEDDAYQVFGSVNQFSEIHIGHHDVVTDARSLRVMFQVYGGSSPNIATDSDGITPGANFIAVRLRNGFTHVGLTEEMAPEGSPPQPPGDWVLRTEIVHPEQGCPAPGAPLPDPPGDMGPADPLDMGPADPLDMNPDDPIDFGVPDDAGMDAMPDPIDATPDPIDAMPDPIDAMPDPIDAMLEPVDAAPDRLDAEAADVGARLDLGPGLDPLEVTRISPTEGRPDRNTEVIVNGAGFLTGGGVVRAELGGTRLLEPEALSGSTLAAVVPAGLAAGTHDLRVIRADGQIAVLPSAFRVGDDVVEPLPPLRLIAVTPDTVTAGRPAELTLAGAGFTDGTVFSVGGAPLEDVVISPDEARGTLVANLAPGIYDVVARRSDEIVRLEQALALRGVPQDDGCRAAPGAPSGAWPGVLLLALVIARRRR